MCPRVRRCSFSIVALIFAGLTLDAAEDYAARYKQLHDKQADGKIESLLNEWRAKRPDDPDAWITSGNYYFNEALQPTVSTRKPQGKDYVITEEKTGKVAGSSRSNRTMF